MLDQHLEVYEGLCNAKKVHIPKFSTFDDLSAISNKLTVHPSGFYPSSGNSFRAGSIREIDKENSCSRGKEVWSSSSTCWNRQEKCFRVLKLHFFVVSVCEFF